MESSGISCVLLVAALCASFEKGLSASIVAAPAPQTTGPPMIITTGRVFREVTKDTIVLPCEVSNLGIYSIAWKRGIAVLTAGNTKVTPDPRIRLVDGVNLEIRDLQTTDAGTYVCQLATIEPTEIAHTLEILVPPRMQHVTSGDSMQVKRGATVTMECVASGNPVPTITWTRKNNLLPNGSKSMEGQSITIQKANRHHAGVYECTASNGVGEPVTQQINLHVLYPPEIEVERSWVHSGEGYEAQLVCIVHAEPTAEVKWFRDTLRLDTTERHIMEVRGSRHSLIIRKVQASDFGNYTCLAENNIGKTRQYIELSGKPHPATFRSRPLSKYADTYNITWTTNSYTPIEEFKLHFRMLPGPAGQSDDDRNQDLNAPYAGSLLYQHQTVRRPTRRENEAHTAQTSLVPTYAWRDVIIPAVPSEHFQQQKSFLMKGLERGARYEAQVSARNRFGWSDVSEKFQFETRTEDDTPHTPSPASAVITDNEVRGGFGLPFFSKASLSTPVGPALLLATSTYVLAFAAFA